VSRVKEAVDCFKGGCSCSQAILATYGLEYGLARKQAMELGSGFAGGMRMGQMCGAVTGSVMVLGLKYAGPDCDQSGGREQVYRAVRRFTSKFRERHGSPLCKELLGVDISTPEGMKAAIEKNLFREICPNLVQSAAQILEQIL
jgi:C_GCAxxG_C_C family probable redox protein